MQRDTLPFTDFGVPKITGGAYSVLQPELSHQLRDIKIKALDATEPHVIASANIGCITHLQSGTDVPVRHWVEMVDAALLSSAAHSTAT